METINDISSYDRSRNTSDESLGAALGVVMVVVLFAAVFAYALPGTNTASNNIKTTSFGSVDVQPTAALDSGDTSMN